MTDDAVRIARAPGRVNLLGEHIDYHDLPVLPVALERGVAIRFTPRTDGTLRLFNADAVFDPVEIRVEGHPTPAPAGDWGNYVRAAVAAVAGLDAPGAFGGFDGLVSSDLPRAAGLSSSSALVVATALALLATHRDPSWPPPDATELAALLARGEHYVGTAGGGMDQAASLGGRAGSVLRVHFDPVRWEARPLPHSWSLVVAHSGIRAEKSGPARAAYNGLRRRGEEARDRLAALLGVEARYGALRAAAAPTELTELARRHLDGPTAAVAAHVLTEADRVDQGWRALAESDRSGFGVAMVASHRSLTDRCGVGHPRLDALVETALRAGADGARLTGAGFGGCVVALCTPGRVEPILAALAACNADAGIDRGEAPVFQVRPGRGAAVEPTGNAAG